MLAFNLAFVSPAAVRWVVGRLTPKAWREPPAAPAPAVAPPPAEAEQPAPAAAAPRQEKPAKPLATTQGKRKR
jgi:hypothetical protein